MTTIKPILNTIKVIPSKLKYNASKASNLSKTLNYGPKVLGAISVAGVAISTFLKDFNATVNEENYFQLKNDPTTGKPFKAAAFQRASAMNIYLGNDVLVTAPTATGKTAVAQYAITKNLKEGGRTFYTTPLKALSNEKFLDFCKIYGEENVGLLTGDTKVNVDAPIIVMTTEVYRNMTESDIFNFDKESRKGVPEGLKTVIFDEVHNLGDMDRGGVWEQSIMFTPKHVQIVSLSATVGNNKFINDWIASTKGRKGTMEVPDDNYIARDTGKKETVLIDVSAKSRHVPLTYSIENAAAEIKTPRGGSRKDKIRAKKEAAKHSQTIFAKPRDDSFKALTKRLKQEDKLPAIYFVFSRAGNRHLLNYLSTESEILNNEREQQEVEKIVQSYIDKGVYLGESLNIDALKKGYAIHNAGLLPAQKSLVEELFQKKLVKIVISTETLAAGINMPTRTTVISSPRKYSSTTDGGEDGKINLTPTQMAQISGRAGRKGLDKEGFCFLISCNNAQSLLYNNLVSAPPDNIESHLDLDYSLVANYLSEFVDTREFEYLFSKSLYAYGSNGKVNKEKLAEILEMFNVKKDILKRDEFIDGNGKLTLKGHLIKLINGYEQIPLINIITNKSILADLNPVQLAGIIGGIANIESKPKDNFMPKPFEIRSQDYEFEIAANNVFAEVESYQFRVGSVYKDRVLKLYPRVMEHVYKWAEYNSLNKDSVKNWQELYYNVLKPARKEEGAMFEEIANTCDLIKQLTDVTKLAVTYSETEYDKIYYQDLDAKLRAALVLLSQKPIV